MHLLIIYLILCCVTSSVFSRPYEYSYYISLPGHYQSLSVRDGAVSINNGPSLAIEPETGFRQGRVNPAFNSSPEVARSFPSGPSFREPGIRADINPNPRFGQRYPITPRNNIEPSPYSPQGVSPTFNQNVPFGRRFPEHSDPDFIRGRGDPDNEEIPEDEIDPLFNQGGRYPGDPENRRFNPNNLPNGELDPQFNRGAPQFGTRIQPLIPRRREVSTESSNPRDIEQNRTKTDREEVTTTKPCTFCGVSRINPMDSIDDRQVNPVSESVEPRNVDSSTDPRVAVPNGITPFGVGYLGYTFQSPFSTYYVVPAL